MKTSNTLKNRLKTGQYVIGTWSVLPSAGAANVMAEAGFDFLIIDMEHGPTSFETAEDMVRATETSGCAPLLRVPANEEWLILRGLEIGSHGIVIPQIICASDAEKAIKAIKYHPEGHRGFSPFTRSGGYTAKSADKIAEHANKNTMAVLLVEGIEGINNLDEILKVPGIDVVYLGTYDLSQSAGFPGQPNHPKVLAFVEQCVKKIRNRGISAGCLAQSEEDIKNWIGLGIQFIPYLADCALLFEACTEIYTKFKKIDTDVKKSNLNS